MFQVCEWKFHTLCIDRFLSLCFIQDNPMCFSGFSAFCKLAVGWKNRDGWDGAPARGACVQIRKKHPLRADKLQQVPLWMNELQNLVLPGSVNYQRASETVGWTAAPIHPPCSRLSPHCWNRNHTWEFGKEPCSVGWRLPLPTNSPWCLHHVIAWYMQSAPMRFVEKIFRGMFECLNGQAFFPRKLMSSWNEDKWNADTFWECLGSACFHFLSQWKLVPWCSPQHQRGQQTQRTGNRLQSSLQKSKEVAQSIPSTCTNIYKHRISVWWMNEWAIEWIDK